MRNPFRYFKTSPDIIRLAVMSVPSSGESVRSALEEFEVSVLESKIGQRIAFAKAMTEGKTVFEVGQKNTLMRRLRS